jgi:hypothetical protein
VRILEQAPGIVRLEVYQVFDVLGAPDDLVVIIFILRKPTGVLVFCQDALGESAACLLEREADELVDEGHVPPVIHEGR